jgi:hypothetical protein
MKNLGEGLLSAPGLAPRHPVRNCAKLLKIARPPEACVAQGVQEQKPGLPAMPAFYSAPAPSLNIPGLFQR